MRIIKKTFGTLLYTLAAVGLLSLPVSAAAEENESSISSTVYASSAGFNTCFGDSLSDDCRAIYDALVWSYIDAGTGLSNGYTGETAISLEEWKYSYTVEDPDKIYEGDSYLEQKEKVENTAAYAYWAFVHDYPECFWAGDLTVNFKSWISESDPTLLYIGKVTVVPEEQYNGWKEKCPEFNAAVLSAVDEINSMLESDSDEGILRAIHDYICDRSDYDYAAASSFGTESCRYAHSAGGFFLEDNASIVCDGYSSAFKVLCDRFSIQCVLIAGTGRSDVHMWNAVYLDGGWYAVDVTWDDTSYSDAYFLVGSDTPTLSGETFSDIHTPDSTRFSSNKAVSFVYPELESEAYG